MLASRFEAMARVAESAQKPKAAAQEVTRESSVQQKPIK
jgi:hypothetical protein